MDKKSVKNKIKRLRAAINHYRYVYHVLDREEISSEALDSLKKELFDLETRFPSLITADSPTQRIGSRPLKKFKKIKRDTPMLSLNDAFSSGDIISWIKRIKKIIPDEQLDFYCEYKIDGLAFQVDYIDGVFAIGSTRGDGIIGEDVTENLKTIESLPLKIREKRAVMEDIRDMSREIKDIVAQFYNGKLSIRGEAFISRDNFKKINETRKKNGLTLFANTRNITAGSIRQLDSKVAAARKLDAFIYDLVGCDKIISHSYRHKLLKILGFKINPYSRECHSIDEIVSFREECKERRDSLGYDIDGIVVLVNNNNLFNRLGVVGKAPRGAIAFKLGLKQTTTRVKNIEVQIGRTGILTPVANLDPVDLGGVTISRATLHNYGELERLGVMIGDTVIIGRAGDVIPDIIGVVHKMRDGKEKKIIIPSRCPSCGEGINREEKGSLIIRCNNPNCLDKKKRIFTHFISRKIFDISGLGGRVIEKLIDNNKVSDPADIFSLKIEDFLDLDGFANKMAENALNSILSSKKIEMNRFIQSFNIKNVGKETATLLASNFKNPEDIMSTSLEELISIKDIGEITARNIYEWFRNKDNIKFLRKLREAGIEIIDEKKGTTLAGKKFLITGTLPSLSRDVIKKKIRLMGGKVLESVSSKIDYIIVGKNPGSKLNRAKRLKIEELSEADFLKMIDSK
ncbi:MAG: NAD-dependent DNA ligase LigA [Candidatus Pacebacteria bacterium]|nr:NAD-dependent DNA ligase LigA [Candidatus Paceibacterota bacterium]